VIEVGMLKRVDVGSVPCAAQCLNFSLQSQLFLVYRGIGCEGCGD
jgi:hypothetical protein